LHHGHSDTIVVTSEVAITVERKAKVRINSANLVGSPVSQKVTASQSEPRVLSNIVAQTTGLATAITIVVARSSTSADPVVVDAWWLHVPRASSSARGDSGGGSRSTTEVRVAVAVVGLGEHGHRDVVTIDHFDVVEVGTADGESELSTSHGSTIRDTTSGRSTCTTRALKTSTDVTAPQDLLTIVREVREHQTIPTTIWRNDMLA
jgi:hypothetical protein